MSGPDGDIIHVNVVNQVSQISVKFVKEQIPKFVLKRRDQSSDFEIKSDQFLVEKRILILYIPCVNCGAPVVIEGKA